MTTDRVGGGFFALLGLFVLWESTGSARRLPLGTLANPGPAYMPDFKSAMEKMQTPVAFKQGDDFRRFFEADARRLVEGVRRVGRIEQK